MLKMKNTTLIISALLALNVSHNAYSESEKSTPAHAGPGMCPVRPEQTSR